MTMQETTMNLKEVPSEPFARRTYLLAHATPPILESSAEYIRERFPQRHLLELAMRFAEHDLLDAPRSDFESLKRTGWLPIVEAMQALDESLNHALTGSYKSSVDSQRRALEIVLVGAYFVSESTTVAEARRWMNAAQTTPFFGPMLVALLKLPPYREAEAQCGWRSLLRSHYYELCDVIHVRGERATYRTRQPSALVFDGCHVPTFSEAALDQTVSTLLQTVQHVAAIVALANPILLVGLPLTEKFGINPPASGFFEDGQAERLWALLPEPMIPFFKALRNDREVTSLEEGFLALPNITEEEFRRQVESHDTWLAEMNRDAVMNTAETDIISDRREETP